jgi:hypothetical protein
MVLPLSLRGRFRTQKGVYGKNILGHRGATDEVFLYDPFKDLLTA